MAGTVADGPLQPEQENHARQIDLLPISRQVPCRCSRILGVFRLPLRFAFLLPCLGSAAEISFSRQIAPLLVEQCVECHRADKVKGSYRLDTWDEMQKSGDSEAPAITPGDPEKSELYRLLVVHDEEDRMPKKADPLPPKSINLIKDWIAAGAVFDGAESQLNKPLHSLFESPENPPAPERYPHPLPVTAMVLSPDLSTLAVSGYHEITLWELDTGTLKKRIGDLPERVMGLAWSGSESGVQQLFVVGGSPGRRGELWQISLDSKAPARRLLQTRDTLHAVALTANGQNLVTAGAGNAIYCLALPEGKIRWESEAHADWVLDLAVSPDGKHLATASRDRTARLIDLQSGEIEATFAAHSSPVSSILFSEDGHSIFSGSADGEIRKWNLEGVGVKDTTLKVGRSQVNALSLAGTHLFAAMADGRLVPLDFAKRKALPPLLTHDDQLRIVQSYRQNNHSPWLLIAGSHNGKVDRLYVQPVDEPSQKAAEPKTQSEPPNLPAPLQFIASPGW